jgi:hypothetical protein
MPGAQDETVTWCPPIGRVIPHVSTEIEDCENVRRTKWPAAVPGASQHKRLYDVTANHLGNLSELLRRSAAVFESLFLEYNRELSAH